MPKACAEREREQQRQRERALRRAAEKELAARDRADAT
eukprot:gene49397-23205_t